MPARALVGQPGIVRHVPRGGLTYVHILLERHQLVEAEGMQAESLLLGDEARRMLNGRARRQIAALLPEVNDPDYRMSPARTLPEGRKLRRLLKRHARNGKPLVDARTQWVKSAQVVPLNAA